MEKHKRLGKNKDMSTPKRAKRSGIMQPDVLGRPTAAKLDLVDVHHLSHGAGEHVTGHAGKNIATDGAPKHVHAIPIHGGMTERQSALAGMGHANATAPDANPANPLAKEPQGKRLVPAPVKPGMRSRTMPHSPLLGELIMSEALNGAPKWRA